jgi:hypothetical protein
MLHIPFTLDRVANVLVTLVVDKTLQPIPLCEAADAPFAMLPCSSRQIVCDACIERSVRPIRHDVDPSAAHSLNLHRVDGRDKPGHDGQQTSRRARSLHRGRNPKKKREAIQHALLLLDCFAALFLAARDSLRIGADRRQYLATTGGGVKLK